MKLTKSSFATKLILFAFAVIVIFSSFLGWFFVRHESEAIKSELNERANTIARNLAYNSEYGVLIEDDKSLSHLIEGVLKEKDVVYVEIENEKGKIITQTEEKRKEVIKEYSASIITKLFGEELSVIPKTDEGKEKIIGRVRLGISLSDLHQKTSQLTKLVLSVMFTVIALSILGMILGVNFFITRPMIPLLSIIKKIGEGDLSQRIKVKTHDEIGELAHSFNKMAEDLSKTLISKSYVDNIIKSMIDTLIVVGPDGTINTVNQATLNLLGYKEDELIGKPMDILFAGKESLKQIILDDFSQKGNISDVEKIYITKNGRQIPVLFSGATMFDRNGKVQGIVCVALDITERKRMEEELKKTLDNLKRFNRLAIGRELRMIELKREVNDLLHSMGRQEKYKIPSSEDVKKQRG